MERQRARRLTRRAKVGGAGRDDQGALDLRAGMRSTQDRGAGEGVEIELPAQRFRQVIVLRRRESREQQARA